MDWYLGDGTTPWTLLQYFADLIDAHTFAYGLRGVFQTRPKVELVAPQSDAHTFAYGLGGVFQTRDKVELVPPQSDSYGGL